MRTGRIPAPPPVPEDDNRLTTMKKYLLLLLLGTFLCACSSDDGEGIPFVTDVVMPSEARTFAPGDEVTVSAKGFEAGDDIMLRIAWPLTNAAISEGYADGVWGVVTSRTESSITFLAPGGYPAGTAEVKLFRRGRAMPLGRISVSDGTPPASYTLYGVRNDDTGEVAISEFDMQTGEIVRTERFPGSHFIHPVNRPGSNCIFGLSLDGGKRSAAFYDLTMRYFRNSGGDRVVTTGVLPNSEAAYLLCEDNYCIILGMTETRTSVVVPPSWRMPEGIGAEMLTGSPFVMNSDGYVMLSVNNAEGCYTPMVFGRHRSAARRSGLCRRDDPLLDRGIRVRCRRTETLRLLRLCRGEGRRDGTPAVRSRGDDLRRGAGGSAGRRTLGNGRDLSRQRYSGSYLHALRLGRRRKPGAGLRPCGEIARHLFRDRLLYGNRAGALILR